MIDLLGAPGAAEMHPELLPLLEDISAGRIPTQKIGTVGLSGQLPVRPIYKKVMPRTVDEALQRLTKKNDVELPGLAGIYYDVGQGAKVATDRDVLCAIPCEFDLDEETRVVGAEGKFPDWFGVMPLTPDDLGPKLDALDLLAKVRGAERACSFVKGAPVLVLLGETGVVVQANKTAAALVALICTGTKEVTLQAEAHNKPAVFRDYETPAKCALVMPWGPINRINKIDLDTVVYTVLPI